MSPIKKLPKNDSKTDLPKLDAEKIIDESDDETEDGEDELDTDDSDDEDEPTAITEIKPIKKSNKKTEKEESDEEVEEEVVESDEEADGEETDEEGGDDNFDDDDGLGGDDDDDAEQIKPNKKATKKPTKKVKDDEPEINPDEEDEEGVGQVDGDLDIEELFAESETIVVGSKKRICKKFVTKYEKVNLLCTRAKQLLGGAKPMVKNTTGLTHLEIAKLEFQHKMIPLKIVRDVPNAEPEIWLLSELEFNN